MRSNISVFHNSPKNSSPELYQIYYLFAFSTVGRALIPFCRKLGLNCTEPKNHPTPGTVSTLIFFENVYLELFWFEETSHLAQSDINTEFNFLPRVNWLETGASPFGFGLSYATDNDNLVAATVEAIGTNETSISEQLLRFCPINLANPEEPICYFVSDYEAKRNRLNRVWATAEQIMNQTLGMRKLTHVKLRVISDQLSLALRAPRSGSLRDRALTTPLVSLCAQNILDIEPRKHPLLELTFDDHNQKRFLDLRPLIPIVLRY